MKVLASLIAVALGSASPSLVHGQARADYGRGDVCKTPGLKCVAYPRRITVQKPACRWLEETVGKTVNSFEVCKDKDGLWRPSGRA
ncbi:MAG: glycine zipper protein [Caulobacteraceae bacterium]|nr:glycine zipper protein [Caulobacteraceae bacterium]